MATTMTRKATMKAVQIHSFGGPEVLRFEDVPTPEPRAGQMLVRVRAAGVNPVDWKIREGHLGKIPLPSIMGVDFSGVVEALGQGAHAFREGEEVLGQVADESGSYAEFAIAPESQIARKPDSLDHIQAAALPVAGLTPWQALFDIARLQPGQTILIHAAAGGVGSFAVQFAKWKGARVIGTASAESIGLVRELGADEVIDYRKQRFEQLVRNVDVVLDTIGGDTQERSWQVLKPGGILVSLVQPPSPQHAGARGVMHRQQPRGDQLAEIAALVVAGKVKVKVEKTFPLREARQAQELSQSGHAHGKIVLVNETA
jgi:NADPH:quinone reductase-like Zn-dependent oxidoreductase